MSYLQHGSRHLPTGSDPIPVSALQALGLPSAYFSKVIAAPITDPAVAANLAFDTVQTPNPEYFSISGGTGQLATGFYLCVGMIQFQTVISWTGHGAMAAFTFFTSSLHTLNMETTTSIGATPSSLNVMTTTDFAYITAGSETLGMSFVSDSATLPSGIAVARAVVVRISGQYSITP